MTTLFLVILGFLGGLVYALHTNRLTIQEVRAEGAQDFLNDRAEEYVQELLAGSYFGLMPKENILLYPKRSIEEKVLSKFPRVQKVSLELDPFKEQVLTLSLTERRENGVWCRALGEEKDCYFIDKEGYVFAPAPVYSDGVIFAYGGFIEEDPLGKQYLDKESLMKINSFVRAIESSADFEIEPVALEYVREGEYKLITSSGGYIFFSDTYGLQYAYDNLQVSLREEGVDMKTLEYIDIRIPNKVFYKHKEGESQEL